MAKRWWLLVRMLIWDDHRRGRLLTVCNKTKPKLVFDAYSEKVKVLLDQKQQAKVHIYYWYNKSNVGIGCFPNGMEIIINGGYFYGRVKKMPFCFISRNLRMWDDLVDWFCFSKLHQMLNLLLFCYMWHLIYDT